MIEMSSLPCKIAVKGRLNQEKFKVNPTDLGSI